MSIIQALLNFITWMSNISDRLSAFSCSNCNPWFVRNTTGIFLSYKVLIDSLAPGMSFRPRNNTPSMSHNTPAKHCLLSIFVQQIVRTACLKIVMFLGFIIKNISAIYIHHQWLLPTCCLGKYLRKTYKILDNFLQWMLQELPQPGNTKQFRSPFCVQRVWYSHFRKKNSIFFF